MGDKVVERDYYFSPRGRLTLLEWVSYGENMP
jgi:hypothetical protein